MRPCDNCGTLGDGAFCERCGKPFPPPVPMAPRQEQVEFEPAGEPQRPVYRQRPLGQQVRLPPPGEPRPYSHETFRPHGAPDVSYTPQRGSAGTALTLAGLSLMFCWVGGLPGLVLGVLAVYAGRKARDEGREMAGNAIAMGYLGIGLSLLFLLAWSFFI